MKTIEISVYTFEELTEEQQQKAIERYFNINVDYEWWDWIYDELDNLGLKCHGFDIDRGSYCKLSFVSSAESVARNIINNHGETCDTYNTALKFLNAYESLSEESNDYDNNIKNLEDEFLQELSEDYLIMLRHEYEYLTSEEAIKETLIVNEYDFTIDGKIY